MKARVIGIAIVVALVALTGYRVVTARKAAAAPVQQQSDAVAVRTARVQKADLTERLELTGTIRARNDVDLFAKAPGRIEQLSAAVGDKVKAGQVLAVIEHKEARWQARAAQAAVQVARAQLDGAKLEYERTEVLFKAGSVPQAQLDGVKVRLSLAEAQLAQAQASAGLAGQNVDNALVTSPIAGTVTRRPVNVGVMVGAGQPLFSVQDMGALKLETSVDAAGWARLQLGQSAQVSVDALPGRTFAAKVSLLAPALDPQTRRAQVEFAVDNTGGQLLPNMFATARVDVGRLEGVAAVPREALLAAPGGAIAFVVKDGTARQVRPRLGATDGQKTAVLEGLNEGDEVAVTALGALSDGARVEVAGEAGSGVQAAR